MAPRINTLNHYLKQLFGKRVQKIPLDAGLGCPNRDRKTGTGGCIYCDPNGSGTGLHRKGVSVREQMQNGIKWARQRYGAGLFIAYFQSYSNTYAPPQRLEALYKEALISPDVVGLFIGTRPDCVNQDVVRVIKKFSKTHLVTVELGLQSAHDRTLKRINRGHDVAEFIRARTLLKKNQIPVCAHVIFGLPGEDRKDMLYTIEFLSKLQIEGVKFHQLYVLKDSPMERLYKKGEFEFLSMEEYCTLVAEAIRRLPPHTVVHRLQGDPPHDRPLLGPGWATKKHEIRSAIMSHFN